MGNHDIALLRYLQNDLPFHQFAMLDGIATIKSYLPRARIDVRRELLGLFPEEHRRFLEGCRAYFETDDLLISHCGVNPERVSSRSDADMFMEGHEDLLADDFMPPKLVVCGHYLQKNGKPLVRERLICLDTGCGTNSGPLTSLLLPELTVVQV